MDHPTERDLSHVPLFADLSEEFRSHVAEHFEVEEHPVGHAIVREGDSGYAFYVIATGQAVVTQDGQELRRLGPGDFFGEISIIGDGRRTATVTAATPVVVWQMFGTSFRVLQSARPEVAGALEAAMAQRLAGN